MSSSDNQDVEQRQKVKLEPIIKVEKLHISRRQIELDQAKMLIHHQLNFHGVDILFPFKPYQIQEDYMRSVIEALNSKSNALLQSPTGTGKTLSLLCACLGWLKQKRASQLIESNGIVNRIYFCSRTHSQLKQIMKELKATAYKPKVCVLGSREQFCLKKEFSNIKDLELNGACKDAVKKKTCQFYNYSGEGGKQQPKILDDVLDIEELQERGRCKKFCPYYYSREIKDDADVIILPYSFFLQQSRFLEFQVILKDSIIIFDEAHNVPSAAEEGTSYKVDQNLIEESNKELDYLEKNLAPNMRTDTQDIKDARQLVNAIGNLIKYFEKESKIEKFRDGTTGFICDLNTLFEKIEQIGGQLLNYNKKKISYDSFKKTSSSGKQYFDYKDMLAGFKKQKDDKSKAQPSSQQTTLFNFNFKKAPLQAQGFDFINEKTSSDDQKDTDQDDNQQNDNQFFSSVSIKSNKSTELSMKKITQISKKLSMIIQDMQTMKCQNIDFFAGFIVGICDMYEQEQLFMKGRTQKKLSDYYKFYFHKSQTKYEQSSINLWCLDPSVAFQNIMNEEPHSLILTSGTLHPMNSWESELNVKFDVKVTTSHIINIQKSVVGGVVKNGPNKTEMNFSFSNRSNGAKIYEELGQFLIQLCGIVPNGILVCFSSGSLMQLARDAWQESQLNIIQRLNAVKDVFFEPRSNVELAATMKQYCSAAESNERGAIMFCVCRGKISEGIDFTDKLARSVVIVGVPFPPAADTWVVTKMDYLDKKNSKENKELESKTLNGKEWYFLCTVRALNQAIGRVIRHKDDYGSIYLCDNRFTQNQFQDQISGWVRPALKNYSTFEYLLNDCSNFFKAKNQSITTFDEILKLGNNQNNTKESVREIAQKELAEGKFSYLQEERNICQGSNSKRKVQGSFKQILIEKEKRVQQNPQSVASPNSNYNDFSKSPSKFQQQQQTVEEQFTNIFIENQKKMISSANSNSGKIQSSIPQNISTKNIFQLIQECESSNSNPFLLEQPQQQDRIYKVPQNQAQEVRGQEKKYFSQAFDNNIQKNGISRVVEPSQMEIESQFSKQNEVKINLKFKDSMTNQSQQQDQDTQFSMNSKKNGMFEQIRQKRRIIINESQEQIPFQKSPMSVEKIIISNSQSQQDLQQHKILRLKSSSISKEPSFMNQRDRSLSQQSLITLNKPLIMKGSRDEMINLFKNGSDDESSNSFEIMRPSNDRESLNMKSVESKESSLNFLNDIFKKHQTQLINDNQIVRESSLDQKVTLSISKSKESSSPQNENLVESGQLKRKRSLKVTPSAKEDVNNQQRSSFIEIINSRNSTGSLKHISPISKLQQNTQSGWQNDEKLSTNQIVISPSEQKLNKQPNQKIMLQNSARGLASFDGDVIKYQKKQNNDEEETPLKTNSKEQDNLCPICYEAPKNNHRSTACQHYACFSCWQTWLAEQLTCPMCRVRCRVAYLEPFQLN